MVFSFNLKCNFLKKLVRKEGQEPALTDGYTLTWSRNCHNYFEGSCKTGENVREAFESVIDKILQSEPKYNRRKTFEKMGSCSVF